MALEAWLVPLARAAATGGVLAALALLFGWSVARRQGPHVSRSLVRNLGPPLLLLGPLVAMRVALPVIYVPRPETLELIRHLLALAAIGGVGWSVVAAATFLDDYVGERFPFTTQDNLMARRVHTRFQVMRRIVLAATILLCSIAALMTFPGMRGLGAGLLASAGVIGIVLGIAARSSVETFIAGMQLAWTQPIRLDDVVILEGEWGRIEEIHATYVVVRLWDQRRLIVPLGHLLSQPFQNWTYKSAALLGAVTVEVDYRTPVEAVRREVGAIVVGSERFDGGFWNLQVVDAGPTTMRLRVLVSAPNADVAWEIRCEVREKLIAYLQSAHPDCLPRVRAEIVPPSVP